MSNTIAFNKTYEYSFSEECNLMLYQYSIKKAVCQIPTYMLINKAIDPEIMRKAIAEEVKRNDCLRIRFVKLKNPETGKKERRQYFTEDLVVNEIPFVDFTGKTNEDMTAYLESDAAKAVHVFKGENFRFILFKAPDGRSGIYANISHMIIDLFGVKILYNDLLKVYDALENGTEMPMPLSSYEKGLEHEIMLKHSEKTYKKMDALFNKMMPEGDCSTFCGIDGGKLLEARRKKEKDPGFKSINQVVLFNPKCSHEVRNISAEKVRKYSEFCEKNKTTFVGLFYSGIMLYLSALNGRALDIATFTIGNRRSTIEQKRQGGCYYITLPFRNKYDENEIISDTLKRIDLGFLEIFRHSDLSYQCMMDHYTKKWHLKVGDSPFSLNVTIIPPGMFDVSDKYETELHGVNAGVATYVQYLLATPQSDGSLDLNYQYNIKLFEQGDAVRFLRGIEEAVDLIVENPEMKFGNILDSLQK